MGEFKPLLPLGGVSALGRLIGSIREAGISEIIVVSGHMAEKIRSAAQEYSPGITVIYNENFSDGMFSSVKAALLYAKKNSKAKNLLIFPVDSPLISASSIKKVIEASEKSPGNFAIVCFMGKKGHPLLIPHKYIDEILKEKNPAGLRTVTDRHDYSGNLIRVETADEGTVLDMDVRAAYEELKEFDKHGSDISVREIMQKRGQRLYMLRHGSTKQHVGKIFLGQTDVALSDIGRKEAKIAAEIMIEKNILPSSIYSSDLKRTAETADIIAAKIGNCDVIKLPGLREMNLGNWDGRYIDEIKNEFPEEYRRRGLAPLNFKLGFDSENFYDVRYRALKTLRQILKQDNEDIFIVSHRGLIRALLGFLGNIPDENAWELDVPRCSLIDPLV